MDKPDIPPPGSKDILDFIESVDGPGPDDEEFDQDITNALVVTEYSVQAVQIAGLDDDGTEAIMDALVLTCRDADGDESQLIFDIGGWEQVMADSVKAVVGFAADVVADEGGD